MYHPCDNVGLLDLVYMYKSETKPQHKNEYIKVFNTIAMINDADHQPEYLIKK